MWSYPNPSRDCYWQGLFLTPLNLTSLTTTARDAEILRKLEKFRRRECTAFTEKLLPPGLAHRQHAPKAITTDCKGNTPKAARSSAWRKSKKLVSTSSGSGKHELLEALDKYRDRRKYLFSAPLVTDDDAELLLVIAGDDDFASQIDYPKVEPGIFELREVVSRKK